MRPGKLELALALLLVLIALTLRIQDLGRDDWHYDEAFHVFAAGSLLEDGTPSLPSGRLYERSIWLTWIGSKLFGAFGESEAVGRIPGVVIGSLAVFFLWGMSRRYVGGAAAVVAAALFALSPFCIALSRFFRYFAEIQLFYIVACLLAARYLSTSVDLRDAWESLRASSLATKIRRAAGVGLIALLAWMGYEDNDLFLLFFPSIGVVLLARWVTDWRREGWRAVLRKTDTVLLSSAGGLLLLVTAAAPRLVVKTLRKAGSLQTFASANADNPLYYAEVLVGDHPLLPVFFVVGSVMLWRRTRWAGLILVSASAVPLVVMSTVLVFRVDRYMAFLLPLVFAVMAFGAVELAIGFTRWLSNRIPGRVAGLSNVTVAGSMLAVLSFVFLVVASPWPAKIPRVLNSPTGIYEGLQRSEIEDSLDALSKAIRAEDAVVAKSSLVVSKYLGRPVTHVITDSHGKPASTRTHYSGAARISSAEDLRRLVEERPRGWVVIEGYQWTPGRSFSVELMQAIETSTQRVVEGVPSSVVVFRWDRSKSQLVRPDADPGPLGVLRRSTLGKSSSSMTRIVRNETPP